MSQYPRSKKEEYGVSTIELVELPMTDEPLTKLKVDSQDVLIPVLNLKKYDSNCHCYAIIERLKLKPITMVDLLYSYQNLSLDNPNFRNMFMANFTRENINLLNMKNPGTMLSPSSQIDKEAFINAMKKSVSENLRKKILVARKEKTKDVQIKRYPAPDKVVPDGVVLELIKNFYEMISGEKVLRPTDPVIKNVNYSMIKDLLFMKSGAMITGDIQSGKYWTTFRTEVTTDKEVDEIKTGTLKDIMSVYITGVDDESLMKNQKYLDKFGKVLLSSQMLEALSITNERKLPVFAYCGEVSMKEKKMMKNSNVEKYIDLMNETLFLTKNRGEYR